MNKACDLIALAIESYKSGEYNAAAKFFASAMGSDDLDSFVTTIIKPAPVAAIQGPVPTSDNTLNPSLSSSMLEEIVEQVEYQFRSESSYLDDDESEIEARSTEGDDEDSVNELGGSVEDEDFELEASNKPSSLATYAVGPVRLKV